MNIEDIDISGLHEDFIVFIGESKRFSYDLFNLYCVRNWKLEDTETMKLFCILHKLDLIKHFAVIGTDSVWAFNETS